MAMGQIKAMITLGIQDFEANMRRAGQQIDKFADNMKKSGDDLKSWGEDLAGLSAGFVALGGVALASAQNIDGAVSLFQSNLGATGKELETLKGNMQNVGSTGVGTFDEIAKAMVDVKQQMKGLEGKELETATHQAMQMSQVMGEDVKAVTKTASQMMKQFGISSEEAFDLIAKGNQKGMNYADDYLDTLNEYSVYFKSLGFEADGMFNTLIAGAEAGAFNLDKVGDAVKEFGIRSKDGSKASTEAFKDLGFNSDKMFQTFAKGGEGANKAFQEVVAKLGGVTNEMKRNEIGVALFGTQYEDMEKDVIKAFGGVENAMDGYKGTAGEVAEANKSFGQLMTGAWNDLQVAIKPVGDILLNVANAVIPPLMEGIKWLSSMFASLPAPIQNVVVALGGIIAVVPILMMGVGTLMNIMGGLIGSISGVGKAYTLLKTNISGAIGFMSKCGSAVLTLSKSLVTLATTGITKVVAGIKLMGNAIVGLGKSMIALAMNPMTWVVVGIIALATAIFLIIKNWDVVKEYIIAFGQAIWNAIKWAFEGIKTVIFTICEWASNYISSVVEFWKGVFQAGLDLIKSIFISIWNGIKWVVQSVLDGIKWYIQTVINTWKTIIETTLNIIKSIFTTIWNAIKSVVQFVMDTILNIIRTVIQGWKNIIEGTMNIIKTVITTVWNTISNVISNVVNGVTSVVSNGWNAVKNTTTSIFNGLKSVVMGIWNGIGSGIQGVVNGIISVINGMVGAMNKIAFDVPSWVPVMGGKKFGFNLPTVPKVSWFQTGGIFTGASVIGVGENGDEAVVPLSNKSRMKPFAEAVSSMIDTDGSGSGGSISNNFNIQSVVVREEADIQKISQQLYKLQQRNNRAKGGMVYV